MTKISALLLLLIPGSSSAALAADAQGLRIGLPAAGISSTPAFTSFAAITTTSLYDAWVFEAPAAVVVTSLMARQAATAGTPVLHKISIQTVSTINGNPSGSVVAAGSYTPVSGNNNLFVSAAIAYDGSGSSIGSYTLTKGTWYAIVIQACADSTLPCVGATAPGAGNSATFTTTVSDLGVLGRPSIGYSDTTSDAGTNWTKAASAQSVFGFSDGTTTYGFPVQTTTATGISSGSEQGMSFTIPSTWWSTYQISGIRFSGTTPAAAKTFKVVLYSGTTVLQSVSVDSDMTVSNNSSSRNFVVYFADATLTALNAGSLYRVGICPQDASNNVALMTLDLPAAADRTAFPGGTIFAYSSRSGCGAACDTTSTAWSADTTTARPMMELILADITAPSGGGQKGYPTIQ
jgi:hypothetical protein